MNELSRFLPQDRVRGGATQLVIDALREAILSGFLIPGMSLREDEIARQLGVSRTPVREAFRQLAEENLVIKANHQGTMVTGITFEDVKALFAIRIAVEGTVAELAAERRTDALVEELYRIHNEMKDAAAKQDPGTIQVLNRRFHRALADATGSFYIQRFMFQIESFIRRLPSTTYSSAVRQQALLSEHEAIIKAIDARDPVRASKAAVRHMTKVREARLLRF